MRKVISLFLVLFAFFSLPVVAQSSNHLEFQGIPIDGKITTFHKQMKRKGFRLDPLNGRRIADTYLYVGHYLGESAKIMINYDSRYKIVYQVTAVMDYFSEEDVVNAYAKIKQLLVDKYSDDPRALRYNTFHFEGEQLDIPTKWFSEEADNDYQQTTISLPTIVDATLMGGKIRLFIRKKDSSADSSLNTYQLYSTYLDWANYRP